MTLFQSASANALLVWDEWLDRYAFNSALFFAEVLKLPPLSWQAAVCEQYDAYERHIAIKSGHGVGKGYLLAGLASHHITCRFPQKTLMTAPSAPQLYGAAWNDFKIFLNKLPDTVRDRLEIFSEDVVLRAAPEESFTSARTSRIDQPEAMQGFRSAGFTLLLCDEAAGIPDPTFEAMSGSGSSPRFTEIWTGNPTRSSGEFYRAFNDPVVTDMWKTHTVSAIGQPHITPDFLEEKRLKYGEDSAEYGYRVLGEFPKAEEDTVIPSYLVTDAIDRDITVNPNTTVVWGLDCARSGSDKSALAKRQGGQLLEVVKTYRIPDLMQLVGKVVSEFKATPQILRPVEICVDVIGLGAGVVDRLRELTLELPNVAIRGVNVAESPSIMSQDRFLNLRAELWYDMREWFSTLSCTMPRDPQLIKDLIGPRSQTTSNGKLKIESKDDMKRRGVPSPDAADALMMTFAGTASMAMFGSRSGSQTALLSEWSNPYV